MSPIESSLRKKTQEAFLPVFFELHNESSSHHRNPQGETHFRMILVSTSFEGQTQVQRQRQVMALFNEERAQGLHALTLRTLTPEEWSLVKDQFVVPSPACAGS